MVVIPRLVYNFNHSKPGPFAEKSLLKQTLEHKASRRTMVNFVSVFVPSEGQHGSPENPVDPEIPVKSMMASGSSPSTLFFILHGGLHTKSSFFSANLVF